MRTIKKEKAMSETEFAIGRHCGVTFAGLKIASLVSLAKGEEDVIAGLSRRFAKKGFAFKFLRKDKDRLLVYICHRGRLEAYLFLPEVRAFLKKFGYTYSSAGEALEQLEGRMNGEFPHEIGVFLGYPLADVCGFLHDPNGCVLCGCWKVYANADEAAKTFERFRRCSACICRHMQRGRSLSQIFNVV